MTKNTVFGIDLGTTYSAIGYVDEFGQPTIILNEDDEPVTSSTIFFETPENVIVGKVAKSSGRAEPLKYCELIKPNMGSADFRREFHGKDYRPEQLSAIILGKLKKYAEEKLGIPVIDVVITVPAYFDEQQRNATEQAGILAGFNVRGIIPEPTAAAIAYAATDAGKKTVLVYDLGGGTFDVTVMTVDGNAIRVVCVKGDHNLGGRQWDDRIVAHLAAEWQQEHGDSEDPLSSPETVQELLHVAEESKRTLTQRRDVPVNFSHSGNRTRTRLTREKFDELTSSLLETTATMTLEAAAEAARLGAPKIDLVLLVGGSSRMPQVKLRLERDFPGVEQKLFDPELAVAKGAAIYANNDRIKEIYREMVGTLTGRSGPIDERSDREIRKKIASQTAGGNIKTVDYAIKTEVVNVSSKSFGLVTVDPQTRAEQVVYLITRNSQVPACKTEVFATLYANQSSVDLKVIESSAEDGPGRPLPVDPLDATNHLLKVITLHLPPGLQAEHPIEVTYSLSKDGGRLQVRGFDPHSGNSIEDSVANLNAIPGDEMESMKGLQKRMTFE